MEGFCRFAGGFCPRWFQYTAGMVSIHYGDGFTTLRGWFHYTAGMVLSQLWDGFIPTLGGCFFPTLGGVFFQGFFPTQGWFFSNPTWVFFQPKVGFFPTQGVFFSNPRWVFFQPKVGWFFSSIRMIFLEHGDAIFRAWGCYFSSMGMLFFEHGDAIF